MRAPPSRRDHPFWDSALRESIKSLEHQTGRTPVADPED